MRRNIAGTKGMQIRLIRGNYNKPHAHRGSVNRCYHETRRYRSRDVTYHVTTWMKLEIAGELSKLEMFRTIEVLTINQYHENL